jgi:hypothetical protein
LRAASRASGLRDQVEHAARGDPHQSLRDRHAERVGRVRDQGRHLEQRRLQRDGARRRDDAGRDGDRLVRAPDDEANEVGQRRRLAHERRGQRQDHLQVGHAVPHDAGRVQHGAQVQGDLVVAASGQQAEHRPGRIEAQLAGHPRAVETGPQLGQAIDQRVSEKGRVDAGSAQQRLLEREDHTQTIDPAPELAHAPGAPGPDLGRHVVEHADARAVRDRGERQVQVGRVDEQGQVRLGVQQRATQTCVGRERARRAREHFDQAADRELRLLYHRLAALGAQLLAAETVDVEVGSTATQRRDDGSRVQVARRVGRGEEDPQDRSSSRLGRLSWMRSARSSAR